MNRLISLLVFANINIRFFVRLVIIYFSFFFIVSSYGFMKFVMVGLKWLILSRKFFLCRIFFIKFGMLLDGVVVGVCGYRLLVEVGEVKK